MISRARIEQIRGWKDRNKVNDFPITDLLAALDEREAVMAELVAYGVPPHIEVALVELLRGGRFEIK